MLPARRAFKVVGGFFLGQGALQGIQILVGLFLVRELSVEAYAQFGLAYGFQIAMGGLMDLGLASTIVPLVGEHGGNTQLVGRYVRAAKFLRDRMFWILAPVTAAAFLAVTHHHHWGIGVQVTLLLSVLITLYSSGKVSYFSAPLFLFGRLREFYVPQTFTALGRLLACIALNIAGALNAWTAAGLGALTAAVNGSLLETRARRHLEWPEHDDAATNREVLRYILPASPAIILSAFQAQISLFLISIFGQTYNIAQVAALGKIGQLFVVMMTFNVIVVEPYVARLRPERILRTYLGLIGLTILLCTPLVLFAFFVPKPFLWLLGSNYNDLGNAVGWVVLAACINHLAGLMWIMNRSRKWLFWSGSILEVLLLLAVQITFIVVVGVRTTLQAVLFTFATSFCYLIAHVYAGVRGFVKGPPATQTASSYVSPL